MHKEIKILVIGPSKSGKSMIANLLAELSDQNLEIYKPTQGCRILEFEVQNIKSQDKKSIEIQLWDCSGDQKFSTCWPALTMDSMGVVLVFNPEENDISDLKPWHDYFIEQQGLKDSQCIIVENTKADKRPTSFGSGLSKLAVVRLNLENDGVDTKLEFSNFVGRVVSEQAKRQERDELKILDNRR